MSAEENHIFFSQLFPQLVKVYFCLICISLPARMLVVTPGRSVEDDLLAVDSEIFPDLSSFFRCGVYQPVIAGITLLYDFVCLMGLHQIPG